MLLLDRDCSKRINGASNHKVDDRALQLVAEQLHRCLRRGDLSCRQGRWRIHCGAAAKQKPGKSPLHCGTQRRLGQPSSDDRQRLFEAAKPVARGATAVLCRSLQPGGRDRLVQVQPLQRMLGGPLPPGLGDDPRSKCRGAAS
ncbi:diguanylate cyclase [Azohydromonas sp. G-1-1-14]|uniref:Diguanylate cyclase n=1 Tax=Azohydromonas caseinilytica TaxID=2728836 RepID=A0A848FFA9_9BURK|nr:diguanylate cyclase [Azohydromonas caseinilytica]